MKHEIPSFYAVRWFDVAFDRGFRAVRGAEVLHNHEKPGGRMGRPGQRPGDAGDVERQATPRLDARDLEGKYARARTSGSRNAVGCDQVRPSGHDALRGR